MSDVPGIGLIWAEAHNGVIGAGGALPWHVPEDLAHFKAITLGAPVVMGRKTWQSLPPRFRPLPGRRNVVVTRQRDWSSPGAEIAASLDDALAIAAAPHAQGESAPDRIWVIGGGELFSAVLGSADMVERTEIDLAVDGDTFAPSLDPTAWREAVVDPTVGWHTSTTGLRYRFRRFERAER